MFMPSIKSIIFLCAGLVAGGLLHAWISGEPAKPSQSMSGPLESLNYYELLTDKEFNTHAANFLLEQDENCPETPAERVVSLVLLHQRIAAPAAATSTVRLHTRQQTASPSWHATG